MSVPYLLVETVTFEKPATETPYPSTADHISFSCTSSTMQGSESPLSMTYKELVAADNKNEVSSWASDALAITTTGAAEETLSVHIKSDADAKHDASSVLFLSSYPTPENQMSIKTSEFAAPAAKFDYNGPDMLYGSAGPDSSTVGATGVSTLGMATSTNAMTAYSEQGPNVNTPLMLHTHLETPPLSLGAMINNHDISPVASMATTTAMATQTINGASIMHSGISRALPLSESEAGSGMDSLVAGISMDSKAHVLHMQSYGASPSGPGAESAGNNNSGFSSADHSIGRPGLATHRVCEDPQLNSIAFWDEKGNVCIPVMETLRKTLNSMGMTAHHTDSLQKNFNDYQFKRMTDQRRTRHTNQHGVVKFQNPNFMPGREDLLVNVIRKSALKKQQNVSSRDRANSASFNRKKNRSSSMRQGNGRVVRQTTGERMNPYMRYGQVEQNTMHGLPISMSPSNSFQSHHGSQPSTFSHMYNPGDQSGMIMPLDVQNLGFGIQQPVGMGEQVHSSLLQTTSNSQYQHSPFYVDQNQSSLVMQNFMPPSQTSLPSSYAQNTEPGVARAQGYQHSDFALPPQYQQASEFGNGHQQNYSPMSLPQQQSYPDIHQTGYYPQQQIPTPGYTGAGSETTPPDTMNNGGYNA
ncbi:hypothetical protein IW140_000735 [Coemansia sp. RSA 1813]|nr:hypothetical protein EV178_000759 [Coemansia sp. RSA 1646]KAJ2572620.1 hypothetical protein IW140_000735 [Coemansia sp. RSA 1813]